MFVKAQNKPINLVSQSFSLPYLLSLIKLSRWSTDWAMAEHICRSSNETYLRDRSPNITFPFRPKPLGKGMNSFILASVMSWIIPEAVSFFSFALTVCERYEFKCSSLRLLINSRADLITLLYWLILTACQLVKVILNLKVLKFCSRYIYIFIFVLFFLKSISAFFYIITVFGFRYITSIPI